MKQQPKTECARCGDIDPLYKVSPWGIYCVQCGFVFPLSATAFDLAVFDTAEEETED